MTQTLSELLQEHLAHKSESAIELNILYAAAERTGREYMHLAGGMFLPTIGAIGNWSAKETQELKELIAARGQQQSVSHYLGSKLAGYDDPNVTHYQAAHRTVERMKPGSIAKVRVAKTEYYMAAFPAERASLVLFVK